MEFLYFIFVGTSFVHAGSECVVDKYGYFLCKR